MTTLKINNCETALLKALRILETKPRLILRQNEHSTTATLYRSKSHPGSATQYLLMPEGASLPDGRAEVLFKDSGSMFSVGGGLKRFTPGFSWFKPLQAQETERRKENRILIPSEESMKIHLHSPKVDIEGEIVDISRGGLRVKMKSYPGLKAGDFLHLNFKLNTSRTPIRVEARFKGWSEGHARFEFYLMRAEDGLSVSQFILNRNLEVQV